MQAASSLKLIGKSQSERAFHNLQNAELPGQMRAANTLAKIAAEQPAERPGVIKGLVELLPGNRALDAFEAIAKAASGNAAERQKLRKTYGAALHENYRLLRDNPATPADKRAYFARIFKHLNDRTGLAELTHDPDPLIRNTGLDAIKAQAEISQKPYLVPVLLRHAHDMQLNELLEKNLTKLEKNQEKVLAIERFLNGLPKPKKPAGRGKSLLSPESGMKDLFKERDQVKEIQGQSIELIKKYYGGYYKRHIAPHLK